MARKTEGPNRSEAIREVFSASPGASANDVIAQLEANGLKVTKSLVYAVKGGMKEKKDRKKRIARAAKAAVSRNGTARKTDAITLIREVKALAGRAGGYAELQELI